MKTEQEIREKLKEIDELIDIAIINEHIQMQMFYNGQQSFLKWALDEIEE